MRGRRAYLVGLAAGALVLAAATSASAATGTTTNLSYTPTRINYGRQAALTTTPGYVSITNTSGGDMFFQSTIIATGLAFLVNPGGSSCYSLSSSTLPTLQTCQIEVDFVPPAKGSCAACKGHYRDTFESDWSSSSVGGPTTDVTITSLSGGSS